jgi:hypothetical protein
MDVTSDMKVELHWWLRNVEIMEAPIFLLPIDVLIQTDASLKGWGAYIPARDLDLVDVGMNLKMASILMNLNLQFTMHSRHVVGITA